MIHRKKRLLPKVLVKKDLQETDGTIMIKKNGDISEKKKSLEDSNGKRDKQEREITYLNKSKQSSKKTKIKIL